MYSIDKVQKERIHYSGTMKRKLQEIIETGNAQVVEQFLVRLPYGVVQQIVLELDIQDVLKLFQLSKGFTNTKLLHEDSDIWLKLFQRDFPDVYNKWNEVFEKEDLLLISLMKKLSWRNIYVATNLVYGLYLVGRPFTNISFVMGRYRVRLTVIFQRYGGLYFKCLYEAYLGNVKHLFNEITLTAMLLFGTDMDIGLGFSFEQSEYDEADIRFKQSILVARIFSLGFKSNISPITLYPMERFTISSCCVSCGKDTPKMKCCNTGLYCGARCQKEDWARHNKEH